MHPSTEAVSGIWKANVEAAREYGQLALDSMEHLFKAQAGSLREVCRLGLNEYTLFWSGNSGKPMDHLPELFAKRLDFAASMGRQYQDRTVQIQGAFLHITEKQLPILNRRLRDALDAILAED